MNDTNNEQLADIRKTLGLDQFTKHKYFKRGLLWGGAVLLLISVVIVWRVMLTAPAVLYKTSPVKRGDLVVTVTATGNLQPTNLVDVGIEVSGTIAELGADFNDQVKRDQVLAKLDTAKLESAVLKSQATLLSAEAQVQQAQATAKQARIELTRLEQVRKLSGGSLPSQHDLNTAQTALQVAIASEANARGVVAQAKATLDSNQTDLTKAVIRSPINGVVLKRWVEVGQTIAASFQAPVLFTLAEDLTRMDLHVNVDEADVGEVKTGQDATFTVDAYPERSFPAGVTQIRYASQAVEGVITYETILKVDNSDLALRPGMTATAEITVKNINDVLLVPNTALRFTPPKTDKKGQDKGGLIGSILPRFPRGTQQAGEEKPVKNNARRVWLLRDAEPVAVPVSIGATDGVMTVLQSGDIKAGDAVVIDAISRVR